MNNTVLFLFLTVLSSPLFSATSTNNTIHFKNVSVKITKSEKNTTAWLKYVNPNNIINGTVYRLIQFDRILSQKEYKNLPEIGVILLDHIPPHAYLAKIDISKAKSIDLETLKIASISKIHANYKYSHALYKNQLLDYSLEKDGRIKIQISLFEGVSPDYAMQKIKTIDISDLNPSYNSKQKLITLSVNQVDVNLLANQPFVKTISEFIPLGEPEDVSSKIVSRTASLDPILHSVSSDKVYDGSGVVITIGDDGDVPNHPDYKGRITRDANTGISTGNHGDHVIGIAMGAGNINPYAEGMAKGSALIYYDYPDNLSNLENSYKNNSARITSSSYGNGCNAGYSTWSETLDEITYQNPELSVFFSAGNSGTKYCGFSRTGYGTITGGHKTAKNVIAVGNLVSNFSLSSSSSKGPTKDGRIKPEICAQGTSVLSVIDNGYGLKTGTSMAAPNTAGFMAKLYQAYKDLNSNNNPKSGLMRAILLNTASDLGTEGPDYSYGFGAINGFKALKAIKNKTYFSANIASNATKTHTINVPQNSSKLKVMLSWVDKKGSPLANSTLISNLDMEVTTPSNQKVKPWVLDPTPANVDLPATKGIDNLNNNEQIEINNPATGTYTISVKGNYIPAVAGSSQDYFISYQIDDNDIHITFPTKNTSVSYSSSNTHYQSIPVTWESPSTLIDFNVELSTDNGVSWQNEKVVPASERHTFLNLSKPVATKALIRIKNFLKVAVSKPFDWIAQPDGLKTGWVCPDTTQIFWNAVPGATHYDVFKLGDKYMEPIVLGVKYLSALVPVKITDDTWIAVRARKNNDVFSLRSTAISNPKTATIPVCLKGVSAELKKQPYFKLINNLSSEGKFEIKTNANAKNDNPLIILDALGRIIKTIPFKRNTTLSIDISKKSNGLYFLYYEGYSLKLVKN